MEGGEDVLSEVVCYVCRRGVETDEAIQPCCGVALLKEIEADFLKWCQGEPQSDVLQSGTVGKQAREGKFSCPNGFHQTCLLTTNGTHPPDLALAMRCQDW